MIVLTNAEGGHAEAIAREIAGRLVPALVRKPAEPIADEDAATTGRLRKMFEGALKGEVDEGFSPTRQRSSSSPGSGATRNGLLRSAP